ncbi:MAG TPA: RsbRD N-terminal domain-containing protein [Terracidiphilus sp.]|nr:RsbRD N-terminal domain-containing protein [Terracidiphilus sp.]
MSVIGDIAERWLKTAVAAYPAKSRPFLAADGDPFRNPVGHTLRDNLAVLVRECLGAMNPEAVETAIDALIRLRAVQDLSPADALRFIFELRAIALDSGTPLPADFSARVDTIALLAFDKYMACREQIFDLRARELRSRLQLSAMEGSLT